MPRTAETGLSLPRFVSAGEALTDFIRIDGQRWLARPGGSPWNVARAVAALGISSAFAGSISLDCFGDELYRLSLEAGLDERFIQRVARPPLLAFVAQTEPAEYFFVGENSADLEFDPERLPPDWLRTIEWLHVGSLSLARPPLSERLLALIDNARSAGRKICFDPNYRTPMTADYDRTLRFVAARADMIKVSDDDLRGLFRTHDADDALRRLRAMSPAASILVTHGAVGAELHVGRDSWRQHAPDIRVVDSVGAGDACTGGLLASLMTDPGAGWERHLRVAVAAGSAACLHAGAAPPDMTAVNALLGSMTHVAVTFTQQ